MRPVPTYEKKILLFVQAPSHNLKPIESFLSKRNFEVHFEADIKEAICKVLELQPIFIFLAWDHTDPKITNLPKLIKQASLATVVPYIMSDAKENIRKLDTCSINPKLYPPISGPAIERLVLKFAKQTTQSDLEYQQMMEIDKTSEDFSEMKAYLLSHLENDAVETINEAKVQENTDEELNNNKLIRCESIRKRNEILKKSKKLKLSDNTVNILKSTFQDKIKLSLENLLSALDETENINHKKAEPPKTYCMSVFSDNWSGYLAIITDAKLDFSSIDIIFSEWLKFQFDNYQEIDEQDFFELKNMDPNHTDQLKEIADYFESIKINKYDLSIGFFSVDPDKMTLELSGDKNLIQISTADIPSDAELNFSLHLHLPENKKYLVYTQTNNALSPKQKNRLLTNKILMLYTPLDYEKEYKNFIAEKNVKELCDSLNKKNSLS